MTLTWKTFPNQIREGFIVDEDEDEEEDEEEDEGSDAEPHPSTIKRKREHRDREHEERLDEDDLELIGEQFGERPKPESQVREIPRPKKKEKKTRIL